MFNLQPIELLIVVKIIFIYFRNVLLKHKLMSIEERKTATQFQYPHCFAF
jgi:hypothetical protein